MKCTAQNHRKWKRYGFLFWTGDISTVTEEDYPLWYILDLRHSKLHDISEYDEEDKINVFEFECVSKSSEDGVEYYEANEYWSLYSYDTLAKLHQVHLKDML